VNKIGNLIVTYFNVILI